MISSICLVGYSSRMLAHEKPDTLVFKYSQKSNTFVFEYDQTLWATAKDGLLPST